MKHKKKKPVVLTPAQLSAVYGKIGGRATSPAKTAAAKANGAKGGRPPGSKSKRRARP